MEKSAELDGLRAKMDLIDEKILKLLAERKKLALEIGKRKRESGLPVLDRKREAVVKKLWAARAESLDLDSKRVSDILCEILKISKEAQAGVK